MDLNKLSGKEKAMIFLSAIGDEASSKVLSSLPDNISSKIADELNFFPKPSEEMIGHVFKELNKLTLQAGDAATQDISNEIEDQLSQKEKTKEPVELPGSPLERISAADLLLKLQNEQIQTIAFVLKQLSGEARENFFQLLSPGRRKDIADLAVEDTKLQAVVKEHLLKLLEKS